MAKVRAVPAGYHTITPYFSVQGAAAAIDFYKQAFGAEELYRFNMPDGKLGHAELQIGDSRLMLADEMPEVPDAIARSPRALGGTTFGMHLYVEDVDARVERAVTAGAKIRRPLTNQFYGDRSATVEDPFGHLWTLASRVEEVSEEEMKRRMAESPKG
jgi:PhnB protein